MTYGIWNMASCQGAQMQHPLDPIMMLRAP